MREVGADIERWRRAGQRVALARVVGLEGSGPRDPGATMAVSEAGEVAGSVSGGCVEGAVVAEALDAMASGGGARRCTFGYSDDEAFAVGLTCGGTIHVLVEPDLPPLYDELRQAVAADEPVALATVVGVGGDQAEERPADVAAPQLGDSLLVHADGRCEGGFDPPQMADVIRRDAQGALDTGLSTTRHYGWNGEARKRAVEVFIEVFAPPPWMVIFGAVDFTAALARVAKVLGYRVTVCDARKAFATPVRFPMADEVVVDWPDRYLAAQSGRLGPRDAICVLTHDPKFDVPAILGALASDVGYIGAMGSRRTHAERSERLRQAGVDADGLGRVMAPIGLDIGARTPEETAVAICAEIIAVRSGRIGGPLRDGTGPIHRPAPVADPV